MSQQPAFTPRKKTILTDYRLPHPKTQEPLPGAKYPAQLMFDQKNNGKIVLKINDGIFKPGANTNHKEVELDGYERNSLFEAVLEATNNPEFGIRQLSIRKHQFVNGAGGGRMSEQPIVQANFTIERDSEGRVSLGYSKGDYKAKFIFQGPNQTVLMVRGADGASEDHGMMSRFGARTWVNFHREVLTQMEVAGWAPPKPRNPPAGGQGGGGGFNNKPNVVEEDFDDIAF